MSASPTAKPLVVVFGADGQLGGALLRLLERDARWRVVGFTPRDVDFSQPESVGPFLDEIAGRERVPRAVINAAAYTAVDQAEREKDLAFAINGAAPGKLARWCAERGAAFVHYSTDYVYPGVGSQFQTEETEPAPLNVYGESKLAGDRAVAAAGGRFLIFRLSWVFDATGKNFANTMLRLGAEREQLNVVSDQIGAPSFAGHLASASLHALERALSAREFPSGIYHLCNSGTCSWHDFATRIFELARQYGYVLRVQKVTPIATANYPTPARRPGNSRMSLDKLKRVFDITMPSWQDGLKAVFEQKKALQR